MIIIGVPKSRRKLSDFEFYNNALTLNKELYLLFKDHLDTSFINKYNKRSFIIDNYNIIDPELKNILKEYNNDVNIIINNTPLWLLQRKRNIILKLSDQLINYIVYANSIYPTCKFEYEKRRIYQDYAICTCRAILAHFQIISLILEEMKIDKYKRYIDMLEYEIHLLKDWRSKNNKFKY